MAVSLAIAVALLQAGKQIMRPALTDIALGYFVQFETNRQQG